MTLQVRDLPETLEAVIVGGDLSKLSAADRVLYYNRVCQSLGLNPLTKPFSYITLNNKLTLYANRDCTDQLRELQEVSVTIPSREKLDGVYVVTAKATLPSGRTDESIGAVSIDGLKGDYLANAFMKAETKAKRRVTLSIVGLGWLDESEIDSIPDAQPVIVAETGEIVQPAQRQPTQRPPAKETAKAPTEMPWTAFWPKAYDLVGSRNQADVHKALGIESLNADWIAKGYTKEEALHVLTEITTGRALDQIIIEDLPPRSEE